MPENDPTIDQKLQHSFLQSLQIRELKPEMGLRLWHLVPKRGNSRPEMDKAFGPKQDKNRTRKSLWSQNKKVRPEQEKSRTRNERKITCIAYGPQTGHKLE